MAKPQSTPAAPDDGQTLSSVVYIGHIPHGFYEKQMKEYFSQFGKVSKIRLSRNKKTGKSKHYAFLQFQSPEVARIVADAMNGYMFFGQKLETRTLMKKDVHPELFKGANRVFKRIPWKKIEIERHNKVRNEEEVQKQARRESRRNNLRAKRIVQAGIDYEFPTHTEKAVPPKKESNDEEKAKTKVKSRKVKENPKNEEKMAKSVEDDKKTVLEQKNNITSSTRRKRGPGSTPEEDGPVKIVPGRMTRGKRKLAEQEVAAVSSPGVEGKKTDRKTRSKK